MNGSEWKALDDRLREIENSSAKTEEHLGNMDEKWEKLEEFVDEIRIELAERKGAEKEAEKNARWAGGVAGGVISGIAIGIKALFFNS